ncbi:M20/M25/M40 family metallo-hydrolase, partial [Clostridioides difficile]|uniref:M20/M25/M40 family metallo-hydrolase n=1 Tax=Clostridioides difficile TaxID=1496 RepID=UPI0015AC8F14
RNDALEEKQMEREMEYALENGQFHVYLQPKYNLNANKIVGADDKAGIAAILEALEHVITEKIPHRDIYLCFTICEEAGMHG